MSFAKHRQNTTCFSMFCCSKSLKDTGCSMNFAQNRQHTHVFQYCYFAIGEIHIFFKCFYFKIFEIHRFFNICIQKSLKYTCLFRSVLLQVVKTHRFFNVSISKSLEYTGFQCFVKNVEIRMLFDVLFSKSLKYTCFSM